MTDTKHWDALRAAGDVPPPTPQTLTRATAHLQMEATRIDRAATRLDGAATRRRRVLVVAASAAAVAGVGLGITVLQQPDGTPNIAPAMTPPASTTTYPPSKPLGGGTGTSASCVVTYPADLVQRRVAFDGTVLSATRAPRTAHGWNVTLQVNEWFRPSTDKQQFTVLMWVAPGHSVQASDLQSYEIGDRLLVSGGPRVHGGDPMDRPVATACGFTRTYDVPTADTWRKVFSK